MKDIDDMANDIIQMIDLGLSVKWGTCNVGATKPEESGNFYSWGETEPKESYLMETYKLCLKIESWVDVEMSKYNIKPDDKNKSVVIKGKIDNLKTLTSADDAANKVLGGKWRTPTIEEFVELRNNCTWQWTTINGVSGYKVSSKKSGLEENYIFLPAVGYKSGTVFQNPGTHGYYWSGTVNEKNSNTALYFSFYEGSIGQYATGRSYGLTIRPVCP